MRTVDNRIKQWRSTPRRHPYYFPFWFYFATREMVLLAWDRAEFILFYFPYWDKKLKKGGCDEIKDVFLFSFFFFTLSMDSGYIWLGLYFLFNLSLTLYNKLLLINFRYPWTLTAIHTLCGTIGCYILYSFNIFTPAKLGDRENIVMILFSVLYTINIAISNVSL